MTQNNIDRHLGRDAQGNKKPAYIMRENVDPSLLVAIPRKRYSLDLQTAMYGGDFWNCTELMFEINNQQIVQMPIQFFIPLQCPSILESKSVKLYLQSFIKTKFDCAHDALRQVEFDISAILKYPIKARFVNDQQYYSMSEHSCVYPNFRNNFQFKVEKKIDFTAFGGIQTFHINDFYSLCPITNQPDFATIYLHVHQAYINRESLLSSIIRNNGKQILSEDACNELFNTLNESVEKCIKECGYKVFLSLCFVFRKRGGISIVPYRENFTFETDSLMEKVRNHSTDQ